MSENPLEVTSISLGEVLERLSASRRLVPLIGTVGLIAGVVFWSVLPRTYVSEATLLPSSGEEGNALGGKVLSLAGSLGLSLPGAALPESHLFPTILKSERIIRNALATPLDPDDPAKGTLEDALGAEGDSEAVRRERAVQRVRHEVLRVGLDEKTAVVRVTVRMPEPELANRTAGIFLDELSRYLQHERAAQARQNREFVESRRNEAADKLARLEEELRAFRETNRRINNSPDLLLEQERLVRNLRIQEEVFLELTRQFEIARIEERKATPVLEILDPPTIHFAPRHPKLAIFAGMGLLLGLFLGSLAAVVFERPLAAVSGARLVASSLLGSRG